MLCARSTSCGWSSVAFVFASRESNSVRRVPTTLVGSKKLSISARATLCPASLSADCAIERSLRVRLASSYRAIGAASSETKSRSPSGSSHFCAIASALARKKTGARSSSRFHARPSAQQRDGLDGSLRRVRIGAFGRFVQTTAHRRTRDMRRIRLRGDGLPPLLDATLRLLALFGSGVALQRRLGQHRRCERHRLVLIHESKGVAEHFAPFGIPLGNGAEQQHARRCAAQQRLHHQRVFGLDLFGALVVVCATQRSRSATVHVDAHAQERHAHLWRQVLGTREQERAAQLGNCPSGRLVRRKRERTRRVAAQLFLQPLDELRDAQRRPPRWHRSCRRRSAPACNPQLRYRDIPRRAAPVRPRYPPRLAIGAC